MSKAATWVTAVGVIALAVTVTLVWVAGLIVAEAYGDVFADQTCIAALDSLRSERAVGGTGPDMEVIGAIADQYCL